MRVFLIGFMGTGKSTLGKVLAARLELPFVDLDSRIEAGEGKSISRIFEEKGEDYFREKERDCLQHSAWPEHFIMATGGGTPCFYDNMEWMNRKGLTVYLRTSPAEIARRLENARDTRPLLKDQRAGSLLSLIEKRLAAREEVYSRARLTLDNDGAPPLEALLDAVRRYQVR